jgi:hypothetical protein
MESFAIRPANWPACRLFSRHPLVRGTDRVEDAVVVFATLLVIIAAACAGVLGTWAHDFQKQKYLAEAAARHTVTATVLGDGIPGAASDSAVSNVVAEWQANGKRHTDKLSWGGPAKAGDRLRIWIDSDGNIVDAPTPVSRAGRDAVVIAFTGWWFTAMVIAHIAGLARARIARLRDVQWEQGIRDLVENKGGWANYS